MMKQLYSVPTGAYRFIVTLTYPGIAPTNPPRWYRDLNRLGSRLRKHFPSSWWFWRLEPTRSGRPHFHLLGSPGQDISSEDFALWLQSAWEDAAQLDQSPRIDVRDAVEGHIPYLLKREPQHLGSDSMEQLWRTAGLRRWGKLLVANIPWAPIQEFHVTPEVAQQAKDYLQGILSQRGNSKLAEVFQVKESDLSSLFEVFAMFSETHNVRTKQSLADKLTWLNDYFVASLTDEEIQGLVAILSSGQRAAA